MSDQALQAIHLLIEGHVQGVAFRYFVQQCASDFSIYGWVRNLTDGRVEILAEGTKHELEDFLIIIEKGPSSSKVTNTICNWIEGTGDYQDFNILVTAARSR